MDDNELLKRIKENDKEAFVQFMHAYGEKLYSRLLLRLGDRKLADKAFREAFIGFYQTLTADDSDDPIESLLFGYGDRACEDLLGDSPDDTVDHSPSVEEPPAPAVESVPAPAPAAPAPCAEVRPAPAVSPVVPASPAPVLSPDAPVSPAPAVPSAPVPAAAPPPPSPRSDAPETEEDEAEAEPDDGAGDEPDPKTGGKGLFGLGVGVLSLGIAAAIWVILGLLMDMQLLPELDLGYAWFSANIAPWF